MLADDYLVALERLEAVQDAETTDEQSRLLDLVLAAARICRGERSPADLAACTGLPEGPLRAAAIGLEVAGLPGTPYRTVEQARPTAGD